MTTLPRPLRAPLLLMLALLVGVASGCSSSKEAMPAWKADEDAYALEARFQPGETYTSVMDMEQSMKMNVMGQTIPMTQTQRQEHAMNVISLQDSVYTLERTLTRMQMSTESDAIPSQSFDTATDTSAAAVQSNPALALIDLPVRIEMTPKGKIMRVDGVEEMASKMKESLQGSLQKEQIESMLDPENIREAMRSISPYPEGPVRVGDSWDVSYAMNMGMPIQVDATYTLTRVEGQTAYTDVSMTMNTPEGGAEMAAGMGAMTMTMSGTSNGTAQFDLPSGLQTQTNMDLNLDMDMTVEAQGQTMDMTATATGQMSQTIRGPSLPAPAPADGNAQ